MRIGSLFSGIGGLELGLEWAGIGGTIWQVEIDESCRRILSKHWPGVTRHKDVRAVGKHNLEHVDLICGGFPCQDVSSAGKRAGLSGARSGLWFEYLRIVSELRPQWVVVENVASGARSWLDVVRTGLGQQGYETFPVPLSAADVGAPHLRKRIFVVANLDASWESSVSVDAEMEESQKPVAHPERKRTPIEPGRAAGTSRKDSVDPARDGGREGWGAQPELVRVAHGLSARVDRARVKALGNSVVPQCAEVVGHVIRMLGSEHGRD